MKIINDGLPEPIYRVLQNDQYDPGESDYTTSSLNQPPYQRQLFRELGDQLTENASDKIWALLGSSVHYVIELAGEKIANYEAEHRYYGTVSTLFGDKKIGAQVDLLDTSSLTIYDMKCTSVYSAMGEPKDEWVQQLNVQRWCIWKHAGKVVNSLNIVGIWRDWSKSKVVTSHDYPRQQCSIIEIPIWTFEQTEDWIRGRVTLHEEAKIETSANTTTCSDEETWAKPTKWAAKKEGSSRATKLFDDEEPAVAFANSKGLVVEERPGERTRCKNYCPASNLCPAYQQFLNN